MSDLDASVSLLIVEDDVAMARSISTGLRQDGLDCHIAASSDEALDFVRAESVQVVLLDLALKSASAVQLLSRLRQVDESLSIILLSPLEDKESRIRGLEEGADDFVIKPFALNEIRARIEAALIRARLQPRTVLEIGPLSMNLTSRRVVHNGKQIQLTPTEFRILEILMRNHGEVVTRKMLCEFLWDPEWEGVTNVIEVHINRLRTKLRNGSQQQMIHTVRGSGYKLRFNETQSHQHFHLDHYRGHANA